MLERLALLLIFTANVILIYKLRPYSETVAGGIELTPLGIFLAGYWFGFKAGIILGIIFILSSYAASISLDPGLIFSVPASVLLGVFGAVAATTGMSILIGMILGVIGYCIITDYLTIKVFESDDYFGMAATDIGMFLTNVVIAKIFF